MSNFRVLVKRTRSNSPPESLDFGELAFSDLDNGLHIGKHDGTIHSFTAATDGGDGGDSASAIPEGTTPPTTPSDGDKWQETDANGYPVELWFWDANKSLWLSSQKRSFIAAGGRRANQSTSYSDSFTRLMVGWPFLLTSWSCQYLFSAPCDATNYWEIGLVEIEPGTSTGFEVTTSIPFIVSTQNDGAGIYTPIVSASHEINTNASIALAFTAVGTPPNAYLVTSFTIEGRRIYA